MNISFPRLGGIILLIFACVVIGFFTAKHQYDTSIAKINSYHDATLQVLQDGVVKLSATVYSQNDTISQLKEEKAQLLLENGVETLVEVPVIVQVREGAPREFESVHELRQWLEADNTSEQQWIFDVYDCDDFARDLVKAAYQDNYLMGIYVDDFCNHTSHLMCTTIIGNGIWAIEPQTDWVWYVMQVDENLKED